MSKQNSNKIKDNPSYFGLIVVLLVAVLIPLASFTYINKVYLPELMLEYNEMAVTMADSEGSDESTRFYTTSNEFHNAGFIDVLNDWEVSGINVERFYASDMSLAEMGVAKKADYPESEYYAWFGPLFLKAQLQINNGVNEIMFVDLNIPDTDLLSGTLPTIINLDDEASSYEILLEPTGTIDGAMRILHNGNIYNYHVVGLNSESTSDADNYFFIRKSCGFNYIGSEYYLEDVDQMFMQAVYNDESRWCGTQMPNLDIN